MKSIQDVCGRTEEPYEMQAAGTLENYYILFNEEDAKRTVAIL
jgi:hypothetical protein